jgi:nucleoside-diphosphate-sugar epimerase
MLHSQALGWLGLPKVFAHAVIFDYPLSPVCIVKRVIVTGGSGFIGTHLVSLLVEQGHEVLNLDKNKPLNPEQTKFHRQADILDAAAVRTVFESFHPQWLFHLAARTDCDETTTVEAGYGVNTTGVANVLAAASNGAPLERALITSSQYVCRPGHQPANDQDYCPHTVYGWSKVETERLARRAGLNCPWVMVRPTNIWGPWHLRYRKQVWHAIQRGFYLHPGGKPVVRSYGYVRNVASQMLGLIAADAAKINGKIFYVGDAPRNLLDWVNGFSFALRDRPVRVVPRPLLRTVALAGDVIGKVRGREFLIHSSRFRSMITSDRAPMSATFELLGPSPFSLKQGVDETVQWLRSYDSGDGLRF